eukprot:TRINITY_DN5102_c0_g1_i3.p1 TRINITY_DN5102_c0_g1~~TRINITY_DN5102_c0_g1_i3.p1  ORF type:complete len:635 (-),score=159.93 TRINITY_DN5102_c0_g1_i3:1392-3296(-)
MDSAAQAQDVQAHDVQPQEAQPQEAQPQAQEGEAQDAPLPMDDDDLDADDNAAQQDAERLDKLLRERDAAVRALQEEQVRASQGAGEASGAQALSEKVRRLIAQAELATLAVGSERRKAGGVGSGSATRRGRQREAEEDAELLKATLDGSSALQHTRLVQQPACIKGGTMRGYQLDGLNWLIQLHETGLNGILADEMGLGKTLQTISLLGFLQERRKNNGPHLIVVPKSTINNWLREIQKWCPALHAVVFHGDQHQRPVIAASLFHSDGSPTFNVLITSFEVVILEKSVLKRFGFEYIIVDEAHRIKNDQSKLSLVIRTLSSKHRLLITGTPLQNNLHELWALLNFLLPNVFADAEEFEQSFNIGESVESVKQEMVQHLHRILKPFLLRRLKNEVEKDLPPKKEIILYVGMSQMQRDIYIALLTKNLEVVNSVAKGGDKVRLLNTLMQLRKACNHPYLFDGREPGPPFSNGPHLVENCGKLILLDKLLPRLMSHQSRVLIFSQMTRMLDILEDYMQMRDYQYCRIDGNTDSEVRSEMIDAFNKPESTKFVFLLSTRAGGLGINLATADIVILYDSDWNPQVDLQAQDRAHRIGQTKPVTVFRFATEGTVEEKIIEKAKKKTTTRRACNSARPFE